jgi:hypothetical protein
MPYGEIEAVESNPQTERKQRQRLWDQYQQYLEEMDAILKEKDSDFYEHPTIQKVMSLAHHISGQLNRDSALSLIDFLRDHQIKKLKDTFRPGWKQITPLAVQILGAIAVGGLGIAPVIGGFSASNTQLFQYASSTTDKLCVSSAGSIGQMMHTWQGGEQAEQQYRVDTDKTLLGDINNMRQQALQASQRRDSAASEDERQRHEMWRTITNSISA